MTSLLLFTFCLLFLLINADIASDWFYVRLSEGGLVIIKKKKEEEIKCECVLKRSTLSTLFIVLFMVWLHCIRLIGINRINEYIQSAISV